MEGCETRLVILGRGGDPDVAVRLPDMPVLVLVLVPVLVQG